MSLKEYFKRFKYPANGLLIVWREESNFRFHIAWMSLTILFSYIFSVSIIEFLIILTMISFVIVAELFNTALEELCDKFQPTHDPHIGKIKDLSAAAVSVAALTALLIGLIIFTPRVINFFTA
ncbi:MAG: diacylglycerol kinase family protein [bacterium]|nr:diacylglycerol kinase family protein [bacterium]